LKSYLPNYEFGTFIHWLLNECGPPCLFLFIGFAIPNAIAGFMSYFYIVGSIVPTSEASASLHLSLGSWIAYLVFNGLFNVLAGLVDVAGLICLVTFFTQSLAVRVLAAAIGLAPIYLPYIAEASLRLHLWDTECDGYDGRFFLSAVHYDKPGMSFAQFPPSFGGQTWQLYQSSQGIYEFSPVEGTSNVVFNFRNMTYTVFDSDTNVQGSGNLTSANEPLNLPEFGLYSENKWTRSCYSPGVDLRNSTGDIIVKTGQTAYTTCANEQICAMKSMGMDAVLVSIGRILVALEQAAACCTKTRYYG
jgi:hypothetical protein